MATASVDHADLLDDTDDEDDAVPVVQRIVPASRAAVLVTVAARWVFELHLRASRGRRSKRLEIDPQMLLVKVDRDTGITRVVGAAYPSRWTAEDDERERERRARQKPPRPSKRAKTRGRKLLDVIGDDDGD